MKTDWQIEDMNDVSGKTFVITGGNEGLGYASAIEIARAGGRVILAGRNPDRTYYATQGIRQLYPNAQVANMALDLTHIDSIRKFSDEFMTKYGELDCLINNAGVVNLKELQRTESGLEMHFATNHLGHFALTGLLLPVLRSTAQSRVINIASHAYKYAALDLDDLSWESRSYNRVKSYGASKLANIMHAKLLDKLFEENFVDSSAISSHPGLVATDRHVRAGVGGKIAKSLAAPIEKGVLSHLYVATIEKVKGGHLYAPRYDIWGEIKAENVDVDMNLAKKLWDISEDLSGVRYQF